MSILGRVARHYWPRWSGMLARLPRQSGQAGSAGTTSCSGLLFLLDRSGVTPAWLACPGLLEQESLPVGPSRPACRPGWSGWTGMLARLAGPARPTGFVYLLWPAVPCSHTGQQVSRAGDEP